MDKTKEKQSSKHATTWQERLKRVFRTEKCPCGSGLPIKKCCGRTGAKDCEYDD